MTILFSPIAQWLARRWIRIQRSLCVNRTRLYTWNDWESEQLKQLKIRSSWLRAFEHLPSTHCWVLCKKFVDCWDVRAYAHIGWVKITPRIDFFSFYATHFISFASICGHACVCVKRKNTYHSTVGYVEIPKQNQNFIRCIAVVDICGDSLSRSTVAHLPILSVLVQERSKWLLVSVRWRYRLI